MRNDEYCGDFGVIDIHCRNDAALTNQNNSLWIPASFLSAGADD